MGILVSWISSTFSGQGPGIATFHQPTTRNSDDSLSRPPLGSTNSSVPAFSSIATQPVPSCETEQRCHVPYADSTLSMQVLATPLAPPTIQGTLTLQNSCHTRLGHADRPARPFPF